MFIVDDDDDDDEYDQMLATIFALRIEGFNVKSAMHSFMCQITHFSKDG